MARIARTLALALAAAGVATYAVYRHARKAALAALDAGARVVDTRAGLVEFAEAGNGPAVLVLHGAGGGWDQGLAFAEPDWGFRFIAPSRPGYLRTPLATGSTPAEQASAMAALLDALDVPNAAVMGLSAGGMAALEFARCYPERCRALVLASAVNAPLPTFPPALRAIQRITPHSEFLVWLASSTPLSCVVPIPGMRARIGDDPEKRALLNRVRRSISPISVRVPGTFNDLAQMAQLRPFPFEWIAAPTLVIHGEADPIVPFVQGERSALGIRGAELMAIADGDHLAYVAHLESVRPVLRAFLQKHAAR